MATSNNPQSKNDGIPTVPKTAPTNAKDFNSFFAEKAAEKMVKAAEKVENRAATFQDRASRPWTPEQTKEFFAKKKEEAANRTPEQLKASRDGFFARKAAQYNVQRENNFGELKAQPAHKSSTDETLYKLAEMRIDHQRELRKDGIQGAAFDKAVEKFDKHFSEPKNLQAVVETAKEKAAETLAHKASDKTASKSHDAGQSL
jgi:lipopolysaccharide export LptBFGC system permease protein LptF